MVTSPSAAPPTEEMLDRAAAVLDGVAHRTPVLTSSELDRRTDARVVLKCECFQRTGSFKFRGAYTAVSSLPDATRRRGVVTHSSGNHGQAVAMAARLFGVPATIVVPDNAPRAKVAAIEGYGARRVPCAPNMASREATAAREIEATGGVLVHPYDDGWIVAGQSTAARELLAECPDLDVLLAPVGGGGLLSGTSLTASRHASDIRVIGAEPAAADDAARSFASGRLEDNASANTLADGLRGRLSLMTLGVIRRHAERIVTVDEDAIVGAMRLLWERLKIVIEPSAAVPVAALLDGTLDLQGARVGVIVSGGNVDLDRLPWHRPATLPPADDAP
ncbi:MAG: threonine/serine dehydratase [Acidobacteriota bacterium]